MPKTSYDPVRDCGTIVNCPILYTLDLIGQKWRIPILWHLSQRQPLRYSELQKIMHGVSGTMLSSALNELCARGILRKDVVEGTTKETYYSYTERGAELIPALRALFAWGEEQMLHDGIVPDQRLSELHS